MSTSRLTFRRGTGSTGTSGSTTKEKKLSKPLISDEDLLLYFNTKDVSSELMTITPTTSTPTYKESLILANVIDNKLPPSKEGFTVFFDFSNNDNYFVYRFLPPSVKSVISEENWHSLDPRTPDVGVVGKKLGFALLTPGTKFEELRKVYDKYDYFIVRGPKYYEQELKISGWFVEVYKQDTYSLYVITRKPLLELVDEFQLELNTVAIRNQRLMSSSQWRLDFQAFLRKLMSKYGLSPHLADDEYMDTWLDAFTNESFDPEHNYETLETLGDNILNTVFVVYILKKFPDLPPSKITQLKRYYMSGEEKQKQQEVAEMMGLPKWVRHLAFEPPRKMYEDILESFFGALFTVASDFDESGYESVQQVIESLYDEIVLDVEAAGESDKSRVGVIFKQHNWLDYTDKPKPRVNAYKKGDLFVFEIYLNDDAVTYIQSFNPRVNGAVPIGIGENLEKSLAEKEAYSKAYKFFTTLGIMETSERERAVDPRLRPLYVKVDQKLRPTYREWAMVHPKTIPGMYQIVATDTEGEKKVLHTIQIEKGTNVGILGYQSLLTTFLERK